MSYTSSPERTSAPYPEPINSTIVPTHRGSASSTHSSSSSIISSPSELDQPTPMNVDSSPERVGRLSRPTSGHRQYSASIIVPKDGDLIQREKPDYPPDDARAMSPRRNSRDLQVLEKGVRDSLQRQAKTLQSSLSALAEKIDEVRSDHDRLENENRFLQDYIGGLTRTVSQDAVGRTSSVRRKGRK